MAEIFAGADALTRAKSDCPSGPSSEIFAVADTGSEAAMAMPVADFGTSPRSMAAFKDGWGNYMYPEIILDSDKSESHIISFEYDDKSGKEFILHNIQIVP